MQIARKLADAITNIVFHFHRPTSKYQAGIQVSKRQRFEKSLAASPKGTENERIKPFKQSSIKL